MIAMIGTSDRLCRLAETCKILLLLLLKLRTAHLLTATDSICNLCNMPAEPV